ncbi:HCNGP domain-containing protein [Aspergillus glaucus CBS 516.65]|uniref:HCNGP-like protein n=1 Tax=Aspergillus glaucus CBS 516.65 TaxID=1160497 RepID=A0A1L9VTK9_ASPGL|nr:hypothetical protein ASPGLDRAFT_143953 [Aspergillus glaucus CBS 516.65]OJJ87245.1 hypothetical protein ASPGLDRAFT_143953 [Aspergillus glaucus CBS 516.65]
MLGLGAYQSSSEDEGENETPLTAPKHETKEQPVQESQAADVNAPKTLEKRSPIPEITTNAEPVGPVLGPSHPQGPHVASGGSPDGPSSPFSTSLALTHDLTLPTVPNLDIPPSPPGSPDPKANAKFAHFLSLKKQGTHFNEKLAGSSSLKNPSLLMKMMKHAGINDEAQYSTSLPPDLWDMSNLPNWGYKEELLKRQQEIRRKTEEKRLSGQRDSIEFVSGTSEGSGRSNLPSSRTKANSAGRGARS